MPPGGDGILREPAGSGRDKVDRPPVWLPLSIAAAVLLSSAVALRHGWLLLAGLATMAAAAHLFEGSTFRTQRWSGHNDHVDVRNRSSNGHGLDREY